MAEQAGELDQLARIVAQVTEREGVAQGVRRNRQPLEAGAPGQACDRPPGSSAPASRHSRLLRNSGSGGRGARAAFGKVMLERAARGRVQRHFARLQSLALADAHAPERSCKLTSPSRSAATSPTRRPACSISCTRA